MMLLAKELGLSPPAAVTPRRRPPPARVPASPSGGSPVAVGDLWLRTKGAGGGGDGFGSHSHESEMDLAMLVTDFLENGGTGGADSRASSDSDSALSDHLADNISVCNTYPSLLCLEQLDRISLSSPVICISFPPQLPIKILTREPF